MKRLQKYKFTALALIIGIGMFILMSLFHIDVFGKITTFLRYLTRHKLDAIGLCFFLIILGIMVDLVRLKRAEVHHLEIQRQRLRVMKATMRTVQDIVNNSLTHLLLIKTQIEQKNALDPKSLGHIDSIIYETSAKLKKLGDLETTPEKEYGGGIYTIDMESVLSQEKEILEDLENTRKKSRMITMSET